jgi:hypothetical protein
MGMGLHTPGTGAPGAATLGRAAPGSAQGSSGRAARREREGEEREREKRGGKAHLGAPRSVATAHQNPTVGTLKQGYPILQYEDVVPTRLSLVVW